MKRLRRWEANYNPHSESADNMQALLATVPTSTVMAYIADVDRRLRDDPDSDVAMMALTVHAPLANRLGMQHLKHSLEDRAFYLLYPEHYRTTMKLLRRNKAARDKEAQRLKRALQHTLDEMGVEASQITARTKKPYSLYTKLRKKSTITDVYDLLALRVLVDREADCYRVLDALHAAFTPDLDRFKDYIKQPKPNGYQSLHTSIYWGKKPVEVQIRTHRMDEQAEYGWAAHWRYDAHKHTKHYQRGAAAEAPQIPERQETYVFSPSGDVYALPDETTPLDFAFAVHTGVGLRTRGAKINGRIRKLETRLESGDVVEIITGKEALPRRDWLHIVTTSKARDRIRLWLKQADRDRHREAGRQKLLTRFGGKLPKNLGPVCQEYGFAETDDLLVAIGTGHIAPDAVYNRTVSASRPSKKTRQKRTRRRAASSSGSRGVLVAGMEDMQYRMASCCHPRPPVAITGYITHSLGVTVHRVECSRVQTSPERLLEARWRPPSAADTSSGVRRAGSGRATRRRQKADGR